MIIRVLGRCCHHGRYYFTRPRYLYIRPQCGTRSSQCRKINTSTPNNNVVTRTIHLVRSNISGYTRVLLVFMGIMIIIVIVAEQAIAKDQIVINVLPQKPNHKVYAYPNSVFEPLMTPKQFIQSKTQVINIFANKGSGKSEFVRQYCDKFIKDGPHFYYKLNKLSNRRNCQVFLIDAKNSQTLGHSLTSLNNKLKQKKGDDGPDEFHNLFHGIKTGLKKQSRWLLIFEDVSPDIDILKLLEGYEDWGDGQIILTSEKPITNCSNSLSLLSVVPRITAEKVYFSIASPDDVTFDSKRLCKLFGNDLRSVVAGANCIALEQQNGNDFNFSNLYETLSSSSNVHSDVIKLYCSLLAIESPKLLFALDFVGKLEKETPIPYKYIQLHMNNNMYDQWTEQLYNYFKHRKSTRPQLPEVLSKSDDNEKTVANLDPEKLSFLARKRYDASVVLGFDPNRDWYPQLKEMIDIIWPKPTDPPEDKEMILLKKCSILKHTPDYGGHVSAFEIDSDIQDAISSIHTEFTVPLLEASAVLEQDLRFNRTWVSKFRSFNAQDQTNKSRIAILGKENVHPTVGKEPGSPTQAQSPAIYDPVLVYKGCPISPENITEYDTLHRKVVLKTLMSFVDVSIPNTVKGTIETILLHEHLSGIKGTLTAPYALLADTCTSHLKCELGHTDNLEDEFKKSLDRAKSEEFKGPSHASALHRYAIWLHKNSRDKEALDLLEEATRFADSLALNRTMAQVLCELERYKEAEKYMEKAVQLVKPGDQDILGPLLTDIGQINMLQGKTVMGIKYVQSAIEGFKNIVGTDDPEYVRALNVVSIGHLMLGDSIRSNRARSEAGRVLAGLKKKQLLNENYAV